MNLIELERTLRQLWLGGMATVLEIQLGQAQAETMAPIALIPCLASDQPPALLSLRHVDPLMHQLTLYRDLIQDRTQENQS